MVLRHKGVSNPISVKCDLLFVQDEGGRTEWHLVAVKELRCVGRTRGFGKKSLSN